MMGKDPRLGQACADFLCEAQVAQGRAPHGKLVREISKALLPEMGQGKVECPNRFGRPTLSGERPLARCEADDTMRSLFFFLCVPRTYTRMKQFLLEFLIDVWRSLSVVFYPSPMHCSLPVVTQFSKFFFSQDVAMVAVVERGSTDGPLGLDGLIRNGLMAFFRLPSGLPDFSARSQAPGGEPVAAEALATEGVRRIDGIDSDKRSEEVECQKRHSLLSWNAGARRGGMTSCVLAPSM